MLYRTSSSILLRFALASLLVSVCAAQQNRPAERGIERRATTDDASRPAPRESTSPQQARNRDGTENAGNARLVPPGQRPGQRRWTLGITIDSASIGVRVRDVLPRSAAARAGLERGDVILTVNGYQVGRVGDRDFALDAELDLRADRSGNVRLLVEDRRNSRLTNVDVRLDREDGSTARPAVINGTVTWRERIALPSDARLVVRIVRHGFLSEENIAEQTFSNPGNSPISFSMRYPREKLDPKRSYVVEAEIWSGPRRMFVSSGTYPLKPDDSSQRVTIEMRRI